MCTLKKILGLLLFVSFLNIFSQDINIGVRDSIYSKILKEYRPVSIYLPASYYKNNTQHYPVLYILDGDYNFRYVSGLIELQSHISENIPEMIIVAISGKGTKQYRKNCKPNLKVKDKGNADKILSFIEKELLPFTNSKFRTSNFKILSGHSVGGIFVTYSALTKPKLFNHYIAISPALWWENNAINELVSTSTDIQPSLFVSLANEKGMGIKSFLSIVTSSIVTSKVFIFILPLILTILFFILYKNKKKIFYLSLIFVLGIIISLFLNYKYYPSNSNFKFKKFSNNNHNSVGEPTYIWALNTIFNDWKVKEKYFVSNKDLIDFHTKTINNYNQSFSISKGVLSNTVFYILNDNILELKKIQNSVRKLYPEQLGFYNSLLIDLYLKQKKYNGIEYLINDELTKSNSVEFYKSVSNYYLEVKDIESAIIAIDKALFLSKDQKLRQWEFNELLEIKEQINNHK